MSSNEPRKAAEAAARGGFGAAPLGSSLCSPDTMGGGKTKTRSPDDQMDIDGPDDHDFSPGLIYHSRISLKRECSWVPTTGAAVLDIVYRMQQL